MRIRSHCRAHRATAAILIALSSAGSVAQSQPDLRIRLPNGQRITPAGTQVAVNSLPLAAASSPDGRHLLVLQAGYETPSLTVMDIAMRTVLSRVELPDAWLGLTFNAAGDKVFVGGGARGGVWELSFTEGALAIEREFELAAECAPDCPSLIGDVRLDADDRILYALDLLRDRVVVINTQSGLVLGDFRTGEAPYRVRLSPDREHLIVSHWGEASLGLYRLADRRLVERIPVGEHPADFVVVPGRVQAPSGDADGEAGSEYSARLFVACTHSDNLWTFGINDSNRYDLLDIRSVAPFPSSAVGSLPSALGLSADAATLYVANAGNNTILVADISEVLPESSGALPSAWFPSGVLGLPDGGIAYLSGKGDGQRPGLVSFLPALRSDQLEFLTAAAVENLRGPVASELPSSAEVDHVVLVLTDARGPAWERLTQEGMRLAGYVPPARGELSQLAWLTSGIESDFFAKLGPALEAGRLTASDLASAGRAALPPAGTLWSNARDASLAAETYGIGGGPVAGTFLSGLQSEAALPDLTVVRLTGSSTVQDSVLEQLMDALRDHPDYESTVTFAVPTAGGKGVAVAGGAVTRRSITSSFVSAPSLLRTIEWLLDLRPTTQFDAAAEPIIGILARDP